MSMLDNLTGFGKLATLVSGTVPGLSAVVSGIQAIDAVVDMFQGSEEEKTVKRTAMYMELAADLAEIIASIMRGLKDGEIDAEEQAAILKEFKELIPGLD